MNLDLLPIRVHRKQCIMSSEIPKRSSFQRRCVMPDELWLCRGLWHMAEAGRVWILSGWVWGRFLCPWIPVWALEALGRGTGCVHSDGARFMSPSSGLWLQAAEARRMLQPAVGAGWSGYNTEQIWPIFSTVAWPQNCSESLLYNILDVPEQVKFLHFLGQWNNNSFFSVL